MLLVPALPDPEVLEPEQNKKQAEFLVEVFDEEDGDCLFVEDDDDGLLAKKDLLYKFELFIYLVGDRLMPAVTSCNRLHVWLVRWRGANRQTWMAAAG